MEDVSLDFIGIGASRSGTSWIAKVLGEHPDVFIPQKKELQFFNKDWEFRRGLSYYGTHFADAKPGQLIGEFTPGYLVSESAAARIKKYFPDAKLILCLRDPVERAYSQYFYHRAKGKEMAETFEAALQGRHREHYLNKGMYAKHLMTYLELFPREQILVLFYSELKRDPRLLVQRLYRFLGVDDAYQPSSLFSDVNTSLADGSLTYVKSLGRLNHFLKERAASRGWRQLITMLRRLGLGRPFRHLIKKNRSRRGSKREQKPVMNPETRKNLYGVFREDILALEKLLGRDIPEWHGWEG